MTISIIAAINMRGVIGKNGHIPWYMPEDLKYFKRMTMGKPVVMGRTTYESLDGPLSGRDNIILTSNIAYKADGCKVIHDFVDVLDMDTDDTEIMIIGGRMIYEIFLTYAHKMYITTIRDNFIEGDTHFPELPWGRYGSAIESQEVTKTHIFTVYKINLER